MSDFKTKEEKASKVSDPRPDTIKVLLIEDNPGDARLVKEMLVDARAGKFSLTHAGLLREGLSLLRDENPHVILLDLSLPDGHGLDTVRKMCAVAAHLPVVILTGLNDETIAIQAVQEGAEDYLVKGQMDGNMLARAIRYAIERKRVEEALRDSEEKYRTILENIEDGYYEVNLAGKYTFFNDSMCQIYGYPREEFMGISYRQYTSQETAKQVFQAYNRVYRTGEAGRGFGHEIIRKDGTKGYIEASISLIKDSSGKPIGFRGIVRDITERKKMEEALYEREEQYRTLLETMEEAYYEVDLGGNLTFMNDSFSKVFARKNMLGINNREYMSKETAQRVYEIFNGVYKTGQPVRSVELEILRGDGKKAVVETSVYLTKNSRGERIGFRGIGRDITERNEIEEALKESEKGLRIIFESMQAGVIIIDPETHLIVDLNPAALELIGISREKIVDSVCHQYICPAERGKCPITDLKQNIENSEQILLTADGGSRQIIKTVVPILLGGCRYLLESFVDITELKRTEELLQQSEEKYRTILENIEDGYYEVDLVGNLTFFNDSMCQIAGRSKEELTGMNNREYTDPENAKKLFQTFNEVYRTGEPRRECDWEVIRRNGTKRCIEASVSLRKDGSGKPVGFRGIVRDVTERKQAEEAVRESEEKFRQLAENIREVFYISEQEIVRYVSPAYMEIWGRTPQHLYENPQSFLDAIHPEDRENVKGSLMNKDQGEVEQVYRIVRPDGSIRWIKDRSFPIYDDLGETLRVVGIAADITDLKLGEEKLKYLSLHDPLTGLYNRVYFEEEMSRIEKGRYDTVGIVSCDVDGLKLVNDTLGHDQGDNLLVTAAGVIQGCFREGDLVARIGGDEFCIILPDTSEPAVEKACQRIQEAVASYNATGPEIPLSISVGSAVSKGANRNPRDLFKEADNSMYRKKLYHTQSVRSAIVKTLINTLKERDLTTESHMIRLEKLLVRLAAFIGLPESTRSDLSLLAKFHDIGKVGISDAILFKEGALTSEESEKMKRHCEIGYRIALSAPELIPIADWILKHHEWWDGTGYPLGIEGEEIPVECRLLALADAYEVLTNVRPYRKTVSHAEAVAELRRYTGTQFDPKLLEKFVQMLETDPPELESEGATTF